MKFRADTRNSVDYVMIILSKLGLRSVMQESYHRMIADRDTKGMFSPGM